MWIVSKWIVRASKDPSLHRFFKTYCGEIYSLLILKTCTINWWSDPFFFIHNWLSPNSISGSFIPHSLLHLYNYNSYEIETDLFVLKLWLHFFSEGLLHNLHDNTFLYVIHNFCKNTSLNTWNWAHFWELQSVWIEF